MFIFPPYNTTPSDLRTALSPLDSHGFPSTTWTIESLWNSDHIPHNFLKSIKIITSVTDDNFRAVMIKSMIIGGFFDQTANATPATLVRGCDWLKKEDGKIVVRIEQLKCKLAKRACGTTRSVQQMSLLSMFDCQRTDLAVEKKKLKQSNEVEFNELDNTFLPADEYVEMKRSELKAECVELWKQNSPMSEINETLAVDVYEKFVKEEHVLKFLAAEETRRSQLKSYLKSKIRFFDSKCDDKNRDKFKDHLSICFGGDDEISGCKRFRGDTLNSVQSKGQRNDDVSDGSPPVARRRRT